jgi:hypothetical protein
MRWAVGDGITGHGRVVRRDVTRCGLHRMTVEQAERFPDLETWVQVLGPTARVLLCDYSERHVAGMLVCGLVLYFKEEKT